MNITYLPSPNYWSYNFGRQIIVLHGTAGSGDSSLGWLRNPSANASANYLIMKDGTIYCLVDPEKGYSAWANGVTGKSDMSNPYIAKGINSDTNLNLISISIEHEADSSDMYNKRIDTMPAAQRRASMDLVRYLCDKFHIPINRDRIVGHYQIDGINRPYCPGVINLDNYVKVLQNSIGPSDTGGGKLETVLNGHVVRGEILLFTRRLFNPLVVLGYPLTEEFVDADGKTTQIFERQVLKYDPSSLGTDWVVSGLRLGADAMPAVIANKALEPTGLIKKFVDKLFNSAVVLGLPFSEKFKDTDGRWTQYFERMVLKEYPEFGTSEWNVQGQLLGRDWGQKRGIL